MKAMSDASHRADGITKGPGIHTDVLYAMLGAAYAHQNKVRTFCVACTCSPPSPLDTGDSHPACAEGAFDMQRTADGVGAISDETSETILGRVYDASNLR